MAFKNFIILFVYRVLMIQTTNGESIVPCYFVFGDSLVDSGNNNDLNTTAKANYLPYGIDFPDGSTGRFTNGLTVTDFTSTYLGFENYIPPAATAKDSEIYKGVNYGSGSCGIRDDTGSHMGQCISMNKQLQNHQKTISRLESLIGNKAAVKKYLSKCLYTVNIGSNDYLLNYFLPQYYKTSRLYNPDAYATHLLNKYHQQIKVLHHSGARKIALFGLGPIGCTPQEIKLYGRNQTGCVEWINDAVQLFNEKLKMLVTNLNAIISGGKYTFINTFAIGSLIPASLGLKDLNQPCCKVITENVSQAGQCMPWEKPCELRVFSIFFDNFHPTEIANIITSFRAYFAPVPNDVYPLSILQLAQLSP